MIDVAYAPQLIALLGLVFILAELLLGLDTGFDLVVVGSILVISGLLGGLIGGLPLTLLPICILTIVYFFFFRKLLRAKLKGNGEALNTDRLIGATGVVLRPVTKGKPGVVLVDGEQWRCTSPVSIAQDAEVVISSVSGVTVSVKPRKP